MSKGRDNDQGREDSGEAAPWPGPAHREPCSTHQAAQDGQEDGDGGRVAHKLCDHGHQDACQEGDSPRREAAQGQHLVADPRGEAGTLQAKGHGQKKGGNAMPVALGAPAAGVWALQEPQGSSDFLPIFRQTGPSGIPGFYGWIVFAAQKSLSDDCTTFSLRVSW